MGIIERPRKDGTVAWQVIMRTTGGKTIVETYNDKASAEMFEKMIGQEMQATRLRKALAARGAMREEPCAMQLHGRHEQADDPHAAHKLYAEELLTDTLRNYSKTTEIAKKSIVSVQTLLRLVGDVRLGQLKKRWVKQFIDHLRTVPTQFGRPHAYSTIQGYISVINCAVRWRAEDLDLSHTPIPFQKTKMFPRNYSNMRTRRLDHGEELALFQALRKLQGPSNRHYRLLVRLALECGARLQEMVLAEWSEFDLQVGIWNIPANHVKTGFGRMVPLTKRCRRVLRVLQGMRDATKKRVFHLLGKPATVSTVFARFVEKAHLVDYTFHDLRHEGISRLVLKQRDLTVDMIMTMVGHSSLAMLRRYTNLRPEELMRRMM